MITLQLPNELTEEFISLIPMQRKIINELLDVGKVIQYSLSIDRSPAWVTIAAASEQKALDILSTFPLIHFMKPEIFELAFHNSVSNDLPKLIMN